MSTRIDWPTREECQWVVARLLERNPTFFKEGVSWPEKLEALIGMWIAQRGGQAHLLYADTPDRQCQSVGPLNGGRCALVNSHVGSHNSMDLHLCADEFWTEVANGGKGAG